MSLNVIYAEGPIPIAVRSGDLVRGSRITGVDPLTGALATSIDAQLTNCYANLRLAIESAGGSLANVGHVSQYFADFARDRESMNPPWVATFPDDNDRPTYKFMTSSHPEGQLVSMDFWAVLNATRQLLAVDGVAHTNPIPLGVRMGEYLFSSRVLPYDPATGKAADGPEAQAKHLFQNVEALLIVGGMAWTNVFQARLFLADLAFLDLITPRWQAAFPDPAARPALNPIKYGTGALQIMIEIVAHQPRQTA